MIRTAIIQSGVVINVVDYEAVPVGVPPGFPPGTSAMAHATVNIGWRLVNGQLVDPNPPPPVAPLPQAEREQPFIDDVDRKDLADRLRNATPAQVKAYVIANVTDLASARLLLTKILLLLAPRV